MANQKPVAVFLDSETIDKGDIDWHVLEAELELVRYKVTDPDQVVERARYAEIIICNKTGLRRAHLQNLTQLKYIIVAATGYDNIDIGAARSKGVRVSNIEGYSTTGVVQQVFAMLLGYLNKPEKYFRMTAEGGWSNQPFFSVWTHSIEELAGKRMGIIGLGTIGQAVAKVAQAFGMEVLSVRRPGKKELTGIAYLPLKELLGTSDIVSLHVPLKEETSNLIDAEKLSWMKPDAILVNTARGAIINEKDLADALRSGSIQAALLDVLSQEPPPADHILSGLENCFITPHQAWASRQSRERLMKGIVECVKAYKQNDFEGISII